MDVKQDSLSPQFIIMPERWSSILFEEEGREGGVCK
ncbi:hypothetical protein BVRB_3g069120 [Beta vulgaris subsp. vulgaris]|nr:hypothetical protein BVRB_3g069120 [Beta vulgaris subsp. vulgaris]